MNQARKFFSVLVLVGIAISTANAAHDRQLREYTNDRYGFVLRYPPGLIAGPERADGSGREFHTSDGEFKVFAFAVPARGNPREVIARSYLHERKLFGGAVSYQRKGETWFVLSGVAANGLEFYSKAYANSSAVTLLRITYPHARNHTYDPWVARIEKNFSSARYVASAQ